MSLHSVSRPVREMTPAHFNPVQWHEATGYARHACARIFRDGGSPADALKVFGLSASERADWGMAVDRIALSLCQRTPALRRAA